LSENEIKSHPLEKHQTKDIHDGHVNGSLIPVWRNWDKTISVQPEMVYVTSINPGERKGPHLHLIRHSYYVCIKGKVVFIIKEKSGKYLEIESSEENPVLVEIPKNYSSAHINLSSEPSIILSVVNPSWKPDNRDEHNVTYDDYDWNKWKKL
jgi:dTDP-4-dehydrorhamnose 3,5-epimerase|tara:strand:- start:8056 stop:8511 length:456 start_codon:yes stop_codon:yes gene_type:complete